MSTYGWTIDQVNEMTVPQMTALIEEIRASRAPTTQVPPSTSRDEEEAISAMGHHVVQEVPEEAPAATSRTGSRIKLFDPKTGRRVL